MMLDVVGEQVVGMAHQSLELLFLPIGSSGRHRDRMNFSFQVGLSLQTRADTCRKDSLYEYF